MTGCHIVKCNVCPFVFRSRMGFMSMYVVSLVCTHCGEQFHAIKKSSWRPELNDRLPIFHLLRDSDRAEPTGLFLTAVESSSPVEPGEPPWAEFPSSALSCPHCQVYGTLVGSLSEGSKCPDCENGTISDLGGFIY